MLKTIDAVIECVNCIFGKKKNVLAQLSNIN